MKISKHFPNNNPSSNFKQKQYKGQLQLFK